MFEDEPRIRVYPVPNKYWQDYFFMFQKMFEKKYRVVKLGSFGSDYMKNKNVRLDAIFYQQASIDLENRWKRFDFPRRPEIEQNLLAKLTTSRTPYIFLHEDAGRNYTINRNLIKSDLPIVTPDSESPFLLIDYAAVIENASEIHCIESSFAAFIESLNPRADKFAHRYARPEARNDFRYEYTYRTDWTILLDGYVND
jgi:hypothetical protein